LAAFTGASAPNVEKVSNVGLAQEKSLFSAAISAENQPDIIRQLPECRKGKKGSELTIDTDPKI
jgi:hypothetical protein